MYGIPDRLKALSAAEEQVLLALWDCKPPVSRRDIGVPPGAVRLRCADFAIAKGYLWPFVMACLRRAAVVAAFVVAVSVGL